MKVRVRVSQDPVAESNCVIMRWGGEVKQSSELFHGSELAVRNESELDSAGSNDELARRWRSLKITALR